jgi:uncharacterized protein YbjQ (UPF0145 family)
MFELIYIVTFMAIAFFYGTYVEKKHLKSLRNRERELSVIPWRSTGKKEVFPRDSKAELLSGHVVIAQDAFKSSIAGLINIFGGRVTVYESLLDRGRREAICRLREQAKALGCREVVNVRLETSTLGVNNSQAAAGSIEVLAYGTGVI